MRVFPKRMQQNIDMTHGLIHSQQVLLLLTDKGVSREVSYRLVQRNAMACWETGTNLKELVSADKELMTHLTADELEHVFDIQNHFRDVDRTFSLLGLS